ncbi:hypothetical protein GCM10007874_55700 [Labrys miyagiensis]|uniref:Cytoplasmic protein n=2 Tax=Labrys miyagiensis TaxID=346912 RepID=A0ABQ6CSK0_9HYPH|nr:crosslink repair DNA glycosylase YcaQ family protein [Labrys miyagiensis]GLS22552.1 hypothetical protein GCM10007874_55700 [Labrys miyagiensis]
MPRKSPFLTKAQARRVLLHAQRLDTLAPFGDSAEATPAAVAHLGYVQIDTINVIERSHHHILWTRIPGYRRAHLTQAQSGDRSVFEYWTHALSYIPTADLRFFLPQMKRYHERPDKWFEGVTKAEMRKVLTLIRKDGPLTIRDIDDDVLVEKEHPWASRKPSKRALQLAFYTGVLAVSAREGMLKTYELMERHFGWDADPALKPKPATERQGLDYLIDRALRSQGIVTLDSICHLVPSLKGAVRERIEARMRKKEILAVDVEEAGKVEHWARPEALEAVSAPPAELVHILSPFDPLVIQRKRLKFFFDYDHRFEAYVPKEKRVFGYFALPVLAGEEVVAAIDLKTDRSGRKLMIQQWSWVGQGGEARHKAVIEEALGRFEAFQLE